MIPNDFPDLSQSGAVLVGIDSFEHDRLPDLPAVPNNVHRLQSILSDPTMVGFPTERVDVVGADARPAEAMATLEKSAKGAEDVLLFYYSGHGVLVGSQSELHLTFRDSDPGRAWTTLPFSYVADVVKSAAAPVKIIVLDCCFSGRGAKDLMGDEASEISDQLKAEGVYVLTATSGTKKAKAPIGAEHTAFTGALLEVICEGIPGAGAGLSMESLYQETRQRMRRSNWPLPEQYNTHSANRTVIVRNVAHGSGTGSPGHPRRLDMSRSRAVVVESFRFDDPDFHDLHESFIAGLDQALVHPSGAGFAEEHRYALQNAGRDQIMRTVVRAASEAEDLLLVHLSGLGELSETDDLYFPARDSIASEPWSQVYISDLLGSLRRTAAHVVLFLDCSYAGSVMIGASRLEDCTVISSCGPREAAFLHSGFTETLLKVLREGVPDAPAHLNALDIYRELQSGMARQKPRLSVSSTTGMPCLVENHHPEARPLTPHVCLMER
ncbi:caspase family protein [Streptomyces sp. NBC_00190]|uniref:caspase, EACC1-associated type n=1 Tax=unclassified Streptomyces TaxID=2593676 RepID=UPI002E2CC7C9|nr:caspase family protein [Streptomyces sp. NBC_00190]WSZ43667.1 caspase family protein [Streptomyces sp. NBC_00868]